MVQAVCVREKPVGLAFFTLLLGAFITMFDLFVVNVAIPAMQEDLSAGVSRMGLVIASYEVGFGGFLIAAGRFGDVFGRRRLYCTGILGFTVTSLLCGIAPDIWTLVLVRFAQGITAALLFPQIYTLLRVLFDDEHRARAFGILGMTLGLAAILGQVVGGLLVDLDLFALGWRMIFLINVPIGAVAALLCFSIPESRLETATRIDVSGAVLITLALVLILFSLLERREAEPAIFRTGLGAGVVLAVFFLYRERALARKKMEPIVDLALFRNGRFSSGRAVVFLIYSTSANLFLCFALLAQQGFGLTALEAGSLFAPASAGFLLASLLAPKIGSKFGTWALPAGMLVYAAGVGALVLSALFTAFLDWKPYYMLPALVLFGCGQGMSMTPLLNFTVSLSDKSHAGIASGLISTMQQIGAACGVAVASLVFSGILENAGNTATNYARSFSLAMICNILAISAGFVIITMILKKR